MFYLPGVCTDTDTKGKQREARVQNILKSLEKTQYLMNTLYKFIFWAQANEILQPFIVGIPFSEIVSMSLVMIWEHNLKLQSQLLKRVLLSSVKTRTRTFFIELSKKKIIRKSVRNLCEHSWKYRVFRILARSFTWLTYNREGFIANFFCLRMTCWPYQLTWGKPVWSAMILYN